MQKTIFFPFLIILVYLLMPAFIIAQDEKNNASTIFEFVVVPAGEFTYGQNNVHLHLAYDYKIMKYEVTNTQYVNYLSEELGAGHLIVDRYRVQGAYEGDSRVDEGLYVFLDMQSAESECKINFKNGKFVIESGYENHPVVDVTWFGANAFSRYYHCRLPTEEEWEKAARGNTGWNFPWGDRADSSRANYFDSGDPFDNSTTPIGYFNGKNYDGFQTTNRPSLYGVYDLAGNVWEWTNSFYSTSTDHRVIRGGSWGYSTYVLPSWVRFNGYPYHGPQVGFRLVKVY